MSAFIQPHRHVVLRLPSEALKVVEIIPDSLISIGKFGSFPANLLLGRPLYTTYEIHESTDDTGSVQTRLRIVPAVELNREAQFDTVSVPDNEADSEAAPTQPETAQDDEALIVKDNRLTVDDASRQTLSMYEIEDLKKAVTGSGREIIERIMSAHRNLDEKTNFSLAKYTLRKMKKYLRRFTVLPMDVGRLAQYLTSNREASRIMELREESLGLINAWGNVHVTPALPEGSPAGKWLVIDDTGGILVASLAEKLGLLDPPEETVNQQTNKPSETTNDQTKTNEDDGEEEEKDDTQNDVPMQDSEATGTEIPKPRIPRPHSRRHPFHASVSKNNSIYVLHPAAQPNLSLLKYFGYSTTHPDPHHSLSRHLLTLSWLQLLAPEHDSAYAEPAKIPHEELDQMKPSKRSAYHRKRRRWSRCTSIVDSARAGEFDGLICATNMLPASLLKHLVPLVKGGGHVVLYSPTIEPLEKAVDLYSKERRATFVSGLDAWRASNEDMTGTPAQTDGTTTEVNGHPDPASWKHTRIGTSHIPEGFTYDEDDYPVDPRLLLGCSLVTSRARQWQVLPGRTHPMMTSRGGGEGYIFTARRVLPVEGKVEARGKFNKKRKI